jgi:hypothetical protein
LPQVGSTIQIARRRSVGTRSGDSPLVMRDALRNVHFLTNRLAG